MHNLCSFPFMYTYPVKWSICKVISNMRYNAHSSGSGGYGIMNSGLYVLTRNTMTVKSQGISNRDLLSLCYERSRSCCDRNMWWLVIGSFLGSSYARNMWYYARSRRTKHFIRVCHDGVMGVIWTNSHVVLRSKNRDWDMIIVRTLKDILRTQYRNDVSVVCGSMHIVSIWMMVLCALYEEN